MNAVQSGDYEKLPARVCQIKLLLQLERVNGLTQKV